MKNKHIAYLIVGASTLFSAGFIAGHFQGRDQGRTEMKQTIIDMIADRQYNSETRTFPSDDPNQAGLAITKNRLP
ncbi:MAG: hypothetical protein V1743_03725, partial [Nanoarchaeota archaeon]